MSRLGELIRTLCPNGVEYKRLGEVCIMQRGTTITQQSTTEGDIPVISGGQKPAYYCDSFNRTGETITVAGSGANAGWVAYWNTPIFVCDAFSIKGTNVCTTKYVYYNLQSMQGRIYATKKGAGIPHVHIKSIENFEIPVPPMEVQEEIVRILDKFTALEAELEAELEARKKQYEHYRDNLLTFSGMGGVSYRRLKEIVVKYTDGMHTLPNTINDKGGYPILSAQNINNGQIDLNTLKYVSKEVFDVENRRTDVKEGDVLLTIVGAVGRVAVVNFNLQALFQRSVCVMRPNVKIVNAKFLKHIIETAGVQKYIYANAHGAVQKGIYLKQIGEIEIPIPPIEEQERIVGILDKFEAICTDLCEGLPAEIEARRRQYEHYRDKLLSFKRI